MREIKTIWQNDYEANGYEITIICIGTKSKCTTLCSNNIFGIQRLFKLKLVDAHLCFPSYF
jgi:hypothetical protein